MTIQTLIASPYRSFSLIRMTVYALAITGLCITLSRVAGAATSGASQRMQEVLECRPGEIVTWNDGVDRPARADALVFTYHPADAPRWFSEATVNATIDMAASAWSACGISATRHRTAEAAKPGQQPIIIQWSERESRGSSPSPMSARARFR